MVVQYVHGKTKVSLLLVNAIGSTDMPFLEYLRSERSVWAWDFFVILWVKGTEESVESTWGWTLSLRIGGDQRNNYDLDLLQGGLCINVKINIALSLTFLICVRCRKCRMWFPNTAVSITPYYFRVSMCLLQWASSALCDDRGEKKPTLLLL